MSEHRDIDAGRIVRVGGGVLLLVAFTMVAMAWLLGWFERRQTAERPPAHALVAAEAPRLPPAPRLQVDPIADLDALRARERAQLGGYAWVDRAGGRVRIPIERAMALVAKGARP